MGMPITFCTGLYVHAIDSHKGSAYLIIIQFPKHLFCADIYINCHIFFLEFRSTVAEIQYFQCFIRNMVLSNTPYQASLVNRQIFPPFRLVVLDHITAVIQTPLMH